MISPYFYPHKGGSQQYMEEIYFHLMQKYKGISVDVITYNTDSAPLHENYRGMNVYRVPCFEILRGQFAIPNYFILWKLISDLFKKHSYDYLNVNTRFFESAWWTPFVAKHHKAKSILTDHCANHPEHPNQVVRSIAKIVDLALVPFISKYYDIITVTNKSTKQFLTSLGVKKTDLIYGGVDIDIFKPEKKQSHRTIFNHTFTEDDLVISFVGRMIHSKGPHILLKAAEELLKTHQNITFIFAGGGEMYNQLKNTRNSNIIFTGSLEKSQIADLMSKSDILVHPSLHHEGFPNVLLESAASGCAIIATDKGGTKEIIINNKTGFLIEPDQHELILKLTDLITNPNIRKNMQLKARQHVVDNFNWKKIDDEFYKLLIKSK